MYKKGERGCSACLARYAWMCGREEELMVTMRVVMVTAVLIAAITETAATPIPTHPHRRHHQAAPRRRHHRQEPDRNRNRGGIEGE